MKRNTLASLLMVLALALPAALCAATYNGGFAQEFLEAGSGARAQAMGGALAASAQGAESLYWNPAGLGFPFGTKASASYFRLFDGGNLSELSFAHSLDFPAGFGLSALNFNMPGISERDASNNVTGQTSDMRLAGLFGFGVQPLENLSAGVAGKYLRQSLAGETAFASDLDVGLSMRFDYFSLGAQYQNVLASPMRRDGVQDKLPRTLRGGIATGIPGWFILEADAVRPQGGSLAVRAGGEFTPWNWVALRGGYDGNYPTFGGGLSVLNIGVDYAIMLHDTLGLSHRFTVSYGFGSPDEGRQRRQKWREEIAESAEQQNRRESLAAERVRKMAESEQRAQTIQGYIVKAQAALDARSFDKAGQFAQLALQIDPANAPALRVLQEIGIETNSTAAAVAVSSAPQGTAPELMNFPTTKSDNPDAVAVVIGVKDYRNPLVPEVSFARNDAKLMREYLVRVLGYKRANVWYLESPTKSDFEQYFGTQGDYRGKLYEMVKDKQADAFVYYTGHGAPDVETKAAYFVPSDADPNLVRLSGYPLDLFYANLAKLPSKHVTAVIDACFSGSYHKGALLAGASPLTVTVRNVQADPKILLFSSSGSDEVSSWYPEKGGCPGSS